MFDVNTKPWRRPRVILSLLPALFVLAASAFTAAAEPKPDPGKLGVRQADITATRIVSFERSGVGGNRYGSLTFLGGLRLTSADKSFGGWSGLAIEADGRGIVAVSDAGQWMTARLGYENGALARFEDARVGPLEALDGQPLGRERDRDAEAVEFLSGTLAKGELLIAFEQNHRIGRFPIGKGGVGAPKNYLRPDRKTGRMSGLKGFEAMTVLDSGRYQGSVVAIAERKRDAKGWHTGYIYRKGQPLAFSLEDIGGFDITGVAVLPGGDLIVLERRFNWLEGVRMRLRRVAIEEVAPGAEITGEVLLAASMAQDIDNMEGIAVHRDASGRAVISILSDDNFNRLFQRTILLQFRLDKGAGDEGAGNERAQAR